MKFGNMHMPHKNPSNSELEKALQACQKANEEGYQDAKVYLDHLKVSIDKASSIINDCVNGMKSFQIHDKSLLKKIKGQLKTVQKEFESSYFDTQENIRKKKQMSSKFNITLFGKTTTGKSTLMEILTHGDGSHMGKGGQRTTRDVRSYEWKGMTVTDVPGIDAYEGDEDDKLAEEAAIYADLILFLIMAGQPESTEADWMVKLKRMDKPMICICNYKQRIGKDANDQSLIRLLKNPELLEERMNIEEMVRQFNVFLSEELPNEKVKFIVTHLLAKYSSEKPEFSTVKEKLSSISRFNQVEEAITREVYRNGVLHRKKSYLSIIDAPLYKQMNQLFAFSKETHSQSLIFHDKITSFEDWCENFNSSELTNLENAVKREFNTLRNSISGFVEKHLEDKNVTGAWNNHCKNYHIQENLNKACKSSFSTLNEKVAETFSELKKEIKFTFDYERSKDLGNYQFTDWKRGAKWVGTIGTVVLGIASLLNFEIGIAAVAWWAISSFFSWIFDSREEKLQKKRIELTEKINKEIDKSEKKAITQIQGWFTNNVESAEKDIKDKLYAIWKSMLSLSCGERELALGYCQNHTEISKKILKNIFTVLKAPSSEIRKIDCIARIPGRRIVIILQEQSSYFFPAAEISSHLGNQEIINVIVFNKRDPQWKQIYNLLNYFAIPAKPYIVKVNNETQTVVYLRNENFTQEQFDSIDLIQQILRIHIIIN